ncbi:MAG: hypothetical protein R3E09_01750 [Novosphingobium sp.]
MDTTPNNPDRRPQITMLHGLDHLEFGKNSTSAIGMKWSALHDAAAVIGPLAEVPDEPMPPTVRDFPAAIGDTGGWRREAAEQGIDDISAVLEPGRSALLAAHAAGANPAVPALAPWREFLPPETRYCC